RRSGKSLPAPAPDRLREYQESAPPAARRCIVGARADPRARYLRSTCGPAAAQCTFGLRRLPTCGPASKEKHPHRSPARIYAATKKHRAHFERRTISGRADQDDIAALQIRQKRVVLGFVEAVDVVDEQYGPAAHAAQEHGIHHHGLDFLDATENGAERDEFAAR